MIAAGINHLINPKFYNQMIPRGINRRFANVSSGFIEIVIGIALIWPVYRSLGGLAVFVLMIAFLPLHIWDFLKDKPAFISKKIAFIRIIIQFVLIYYGWWIWISY